MKNRIIIILAIFTMAMSGCKKDKDPELDASPKSLDFAAAGEQKTVNVKSNVSWTISGKPDWLTISELSGKGDKQVTVTAAANTGAARDITLTIAAKGAGPITIKVEQAAAQITIVNHKEIGGVTAPVTGAEPVEAIDETA